MNFAHWKWFWGRVKSRLISQVYLEFIWCQIPKVILCMQFFYKIYQILSNKIFSWISYKKLLAWNSLRAAPIDRQHFSTIPIYMLYLQILAESQLLRLKSRNLSLLLLSMHLHCVESTRKHKVRWIKTKDQLRGVFGRKKIFMKNFKSLENGILVNKICILMQKSILYMRKWG